jgi:hypothetical protein
MPSRGRPPFARDFPRTVALDELVEAFARGNYAWVRAEGPRLAESAQDESVRRAACTLVARTAPDPLAVWLLVLTGVLLIALSAYWIAHGKRPPSSAPNGSRSDSASGSPHAHRTVEPSGLAARLV